MAIHNESNFDVDVSWPASGPDWSAHGFTAGTATYRTVCAALFAGAPAEFVVHPVGGNSDYRVPADGAAAFIPDGARAVILHLSYFRNFSTVEVR